MSRPTYQAIKQAMDVVGAAISLALLWPLFLLVALMIKLDSPGPILFPQTRTGLAGRRFALLKFRSMLQGAEQLREEMASRDVTGPVFKLKDDPRITRIGRWLRRWSLDELPQLINVLRGEMSLVGPRPLVVEDIARAETIPPEGVEGYREWQQRRLKVKPGVTGPWQVSGRSDLPLQGWIRCDLDYVENRSFRLDLQILLQTLPAIISGKGAW